MPGTLYGIGCGPGAPDQITLQAWKLLQRVPVVAVPQGRHNAPGVAAQIIQHHVPATTRILPLAFAFSHDEVATTRLWQEAVDQLLVPLHQGLDVAFVCEGDSSLYSTFAYLVQGLADHPDVNIQVIPGVCSPCAAAAAVGIPLVQQAERLLILPALSPGVDLAAAVTQAEVVVLLKMAGRYRELWAWLRAHRLLTSSYVVEWVGWPQQRIYRDLEPYPGLQLSYFSLMVIRPQGQPQRNVHSYRSAGSAGA